MDPSSDGYFWWLAVISIAVLYNLLVIIARAVFNQLHEQVFWFAFDYICDVIYLLDMFVQLRTGKLKHHAYYNYSTAVYKYEAV